MLLYLKIAPSNKIRRYFYIYFMSENTTSLETVLKTYFGYDSFRSHQKEIIESVLKKQDSIVLMPTGGGKSLCFQLPALCLPGLTLVVSPLIALMKDQVDSLNANGIPAVAMTSAIDFDELKTIERDLIDGQYKLLYIAPERLKNFYFREFLQRVSVSLIAIDEAHCISDWGHDFRPDYRNLKELRLSYAKIPCIALTATATPQVLADIEQQLCLENANTFVTSFNRENLSYHIHSKDQQFDKLLHYLKKHEDGSTVIYRFSRKGTESLAKDLRAAGYRAGIYHAGLSSDDRRKVQDAFIKDDLQIMVATIAFGMGIDKPDVRLVVHYEMPKSVEGYFQETGRAGRDGLPSECILFYSPGDIYKQKFFINRITLEKEKQQAQKKLDEVAQYCELTSCRRKFLLNYFGEDYNQENCENCDSCLHPKELVDMTELAKHLIQTIAESGQRWGMAQITHMAKGSKRKSIKDAGLDQLKKFGCASNYSPNEIKYYLEQMLRNGYLRKTTGEYPVIMLTLKSKEVFTKNEPVRLLPLEQQIVVESPKPEILLDYDRRLFALLKALRKAIAEEKNVPPFIIFGDTTLIEMATYYPKSKESLFKIKGVGEEKLQEFGGEFLQCIATYTEAEDLQEQPIPTRSTTTTTSRKKKKTLGASHLETKELIESGLSVAKVAKKKGIAEKTVVAHLEDFIKRGEDLSFDHLKKDVPNLESIQSAFTESGSHLLKPVYLALDEAISYEEIRIARLFTLKLGQEN